MDGTSVKNRGILNIGVVGCGFMGRTHSNAFRQARQVREIPGGKLIITDSHPITGICRTHASLFTEMDEVGMMGESIIKNPTSFVLKSSSSNR